MHLDRLSRRVARAGCATALAVLWLLKGGPRVAGCIGGSALHGPDAGPALEEVALSLHAQGLETGLANLDKMPQATALLAEAGLDISNELWTQGYYTQVLDPGAAIRAQRGSPVISIWYTYGGAVQKLEVASTAVL